MSDSVNQCKKGQIETFLHTETLSLQTFKKEYSTLINKNILTCLRVHWLVYTGIRLYFTNMLIFTLRPSNCKVKTNLHSITFFLNEETKLAKL